MKQKDFKQKCREAVISKMIGLFLIGAGFFTGAHAQVTIGSEAAPADGALLDVKQQNAANGGETSKKGILFPRVKLTSLTSLSPLVASPNDATVKSTHKGIVVYNITVSASNNLKEGLYSWNGNEWVYSQDTQSWNMTGNAGTDPAKNYVGTSDAKALSIRTNNTERIRVSEDGKTYLKKTDAAPPSNGVSQLVRDNTTGEVLSLVTGKNSKAINYLVYELECAANGAEDWIADFDTKIEVDEFTLVVVGSSFATLPIGVTVGLKMYEDGDLSIKGTFAPSTVLAFYEETLKHDTWHLKADYSRASPANGKPGVWTIYCLAINKSIVKEAGVIKFKMPSSKGVATAPPAGLYD
ncbi:MAG: hypothetical protein LBL58_19465 [Tannerellaceae bacterium]|jgi:hypothetical protein|nr:hypothetical protein [Tannerellaceae bacterium]